MAGRDVFPANKPGMGNFRYGFSHKDEIAIRQEIDQLKRASEEKMMAIKLDKKKIVRLKVDEDDTIAKLSPEFGRKRMPYRRKQEPIFHEDLVIDSTRKVLDTSKDVLTVPNYNPLDKSVIPPSTSKTKKYPFTKEEQVTTQEMRKPHVSALGVLPSRSTKDIKGLNVIMAGKPAGGKDDHSIAAIREANTTVSTKEKSKLNREPRKETEKCQDTASPKSKVTKPAIVGSIGTLAPVSFSTRAKPPIRTRSENIDTGPTPRPPKSRASSRASSKATSKKSKSADSSRMKAVRSRASAKRRAADSGSSSEDSSDDERHRLNASGVSFRDKSLPASAKSVASQKSISELVAEAEAIAAGGKPDKDGEKGVDEEKEVEVETPVPVERSVDDIIASLKASRGGKREMSAADIKIQQIMQSVMVRAKAVLGDDMEEEVAEEEEEEESEEKKEEEEDGYEQADIVPGLPDISVIIEAAEEDETTDDQELLDDINENIEDEAAVTDANGVEIVQPPKSEDALEEDKKPEDAVTTKPSQVEFDEKIELIPDEGIVVDLEQAWQDVNAPESVTYEDIVNIEGEIQPLESRIEISKTDLPRAKSKIPIFSSSVSFLSTWAPKEKPKTEKKQPPREPERMSIHHFCTHAPELPLPGHLQAVSRTYHTPAKYGIQQNMDRHSRFTTQSYYSQLSDSQHTMQQQIDDYQDRDRRMSAAAKRILEVASDDSLDAWQQRADELFNGEDCDRVDGKKMSVNTDVSRLYWTPAPPKMDVPPAYVKSHLFPGYHGAALAEESVQAPTIGEESGESEAELVSIYDEGDVEEKLQRERTLTRVYGSNEDVSKVPKPRQLKPKTPARSPSVSSKSTTEPERMKKKGAPLPIRVRVKDIELPEDLPLSVAADKLYNSVQKWDDIPQFKAYIEALSGSAKCSNVSKGSLVFEVDCNNPKAADAVWSAYQSGRLEQLLKESLMKKTGAHRLVLEIVIGEEEFQGLKRELSEAEEQDEDIGAMVTGDKARPSRTSVAEMRQMFSKMATINPSEKQRPFEIPDEDIFPAEVPIRRAVSCPNLHEEEEEWDITFPGDFNTYMKELQIQKQQIEDVKSGKMKEPYSKAEEDPAREIVSSLSRSIEQLTPVQVIKKVESPTPAEVAREAGLKYVILPSKPKKKKKKRADPRRLEQIDRFLRESPKQLVRSESLPRVTLPVEPQLRVPRHVRHGRRPSIPNILNFDEYIEKHHVEEGTDLREWARDIWNDWFDEVFPPSYRDTETPVTDIGSDIEVTPTRKRASIASSVMSEHIDAIDPLPEIEDDEEYSEEVGEEIERLTRSIDLAEDQPSPFDLCRRGALYRKIGQLRLAWADLDEAIALEPQLLDAYWHRHLLFLLKNKPKKALDDLNAVLKLNKQHAGAYRSRAEIFRKQGDITMAIVNFTQALKLEPDDYEAYYRRAEMYEKRGEILLALEDYREATKLMPSKTEAIYKHGEYHFNQGNWIAAVKDFTEMLIQEPNNALARTFRGRALAKQGSFTSAIQDLSIAIHLDPFNAVAFYHRGCLLRKAHPKKSLQDLSVSILIDDSQDNVLAYLHRGILYMDMERYEDAVADFEEVIRLDRSIACPHLNLGLISMIRLENYFKAITHFTNAIKVDATYWRALVCRAEAYHKLHELKNSLLDYTRAIHLKPDLQHLYMNRGQILLEMKNLDLASFCVRHAAELSSGLGVSATQQAAVFSFLQEYSKATESLSAASRVRPTVPTYVLLGKTQIKDKKHDQAIESLEKALELMRQTMQTALDIKRKQRQHMVMPAWKPWQDKEPWPKEAAEVQFLIGMCQMELVNYVKAFEAFNSAIRINPEYAEAYYQRGLVRMRLKQSKGVQDFNRALAINPTLYQAYLSRAAFYGMKGRYSKGIINCNEAIKLQPHSVRAYMYRGALKYHIHAFDLAIRDLTKAIDIDNTCSLAYFNRAVCYHTMKQYDKALRDYGIVLLLGEENALKVLINRGLMYFERKDYKNALQDFYNAVKVEPNDPKIRHTLGLCFHKLNKLEEAVKTYTGALEVDRYFLDALIGRGNAFMDYGHDIATVAARHDYETAIHTDPLCLPARVNLGYNLQVTGKFQQAWNHFTACLQIDPDYKPALEGRSIVCLQMRDTAAAFQDMNTAIQISPSAEMLTNRGVIHQFMGDRTNAVKDYQAAIKLDETYSLAYFNAANLYFHTRQFRQAKDYYKKAFENNPRDEAAVLNRAITKVMMKDAQGALEDFKLAEKLSPHSAHVFFNRGNLFMSLGQFDNAEKDYTLALTLKPDDALVHKRRADVLGKLGRKDEAIVDYKRAIEIQSKKHI